MGPSCASVTHSDFAIALNRCTTPTQTDPLAGSHKNGQGNRRMTPEEYMTSRVDHQINWYDTRSQNSQWWYKRLRVVEVALAASLPFLVGNITESTAWLKVVAGAVGVIVAIIAGLLALFKFQENWIQFRTTCESLGHHKYRFLTGVPPYSGPTAFEEFVTNVEALISRENTAWAQITKPDVQED